MRSARAVGGSSSNARGILAQRDWTPLQRQLLEGYFTNLDNQAEARARFLRLISEQICAEPLMLRCMKLLGIGKINAFALLAVIGVVRRFDRPEKLVAYIGLNPGQRQSGNGKNIKLGETSSAVRDVPPLRSATEMRVVGPTLRSASEMRVVGLDRPLPGTKQNRRSFARKLRRHRKPTLLVPQPTGPQVSYPKMIRPNAGGGTRRPLSG